MTDPRIWYDRLHLETSGPEDGPPVLLLHGWGSQARLMEPIARALDDVYRVYNVDLPGHGLSPPPPEAWGVPEHAAMLDAFIEARIGGPVVLVGHSNGGRLSLYLASEPQSAPRVRALVLISPSGIRPRRTWRYYVRSTTARLLKAPFTLLPGALKPYGLDWLRHSLAWRLLGSSDYRALQGVMRETFVKTVNCHLDDRVDRIKAPVLVFWGDRDQAVSRLQVETLERRIPDAGLVVLPGAGHYGYLDDPGTFNPAMRYFIETVTTQAAVG